MDNPDNGKGNHQLGSRSEMIPGSSTQNSSPSRRTIELIPASVGSLSTVLAADKACTDNQSATVSCSPSDAERASSVEGQIILSRSADSTNSVSSTSIPVLFQNMSTLGSMARAAEYQAARAAKARQASRETEVQKLPPKPAPISLSAFTKDQSTSRNKGNKAWKPLTLDDLGPNSNESSESVTLREPTSSRTSSHTRIRDRPDTRGLLVEPIAHNTGDFKIPTAPKAMLLQCDQSNVGVDPTPQQIPTQYATNRRMQNHPAPEETLKHGMQGRSLLAVPPFQHYDVPSRGIAYLHHMPHLGASPDQLDPMSVTTMSPHDAHPAARETPSRQGGGQTQHVPDYIPHLTHVPLGFSPHIAPPFGVYDDSPNRYYNPHDYNPSSHAQMHLSSHEVTPPSYFPHQHTDHFHEISPNHHGPGRSVSQHATLYHPENQKPDLPYDRARMMQQAKVTLEKASLERKGKTVLHNPALDRSQEKQQGAMNMSEVTRFGQGTHPIPFHVEQWQELETKMLEAENSRREECSAFKKTDAGGTKPQICDSGEVGTVLRPDVFGKGMVLMRRPPPGLEPPKDLNDDGQAGGLKELSDDFWSLKPMGMAEVKRVRRLAEEAREYLAGTVKTPLHAKIDGESINAVRIKQSKDLFTRRSYVAAKVHEKAIKDQAIEEKSEEEQSAEGMVIENVISNFQYYVEQCRLPEEERTLPFKVKPVPEYAIERPSVLTGGASIFSSFFEEPVAKGEAETTLLPTPKRIARDPRFRPAVPKDGGKLKTGEERMARRDLYGRRVV